MPLEEQTYREWVKETLTEIKTQTIKTNGRVTRLEKAIMVTSAAGTMWVAIKAPDLLSTIKLFI